MPTMYVVVPSIFVFHLDGVNPAQTNYAQTEMLTNCRVKTPEQTHA